MSQKNSSSNTNLRIFWSVDGRLKSFYYFRFSGNELYWGNSFELYHEPQFDIVNLEIEKEQLIHWGDFKPSLPLQIKNSYHASGQVHTTVRANNQTNVIPIRELGFWPQKDKIKSPILLDAVITKSISAYPDYSGKLDKKNKHNLILNVEKSDEHQQFFLEFFLCPKGPNIFPEPILRTQNISKTHKAPLLPLDENLFLVVRIIPMQGSTSEIPVDVEIGFTKLESSTQ